jgi:hypothetical protein
VVPAGLLARLAPAPTLEKKQPNEPPADTKAVELAAMEAVMAAERALGFDPRDVSAAKVGYDVESRIPGTGKLRFIEVKGRVADARTVTITKNEILTALNKPEDYMLALVVVDNSDTDVRYVRTPFAREPDFGVTSVNYDLDELWARGQSPAAPSRFPVRAALSPKSRAALMSDEVE